jgi:hypothetical protein
MSSREGSRIVAHGRSAIHQGGIPVTLLWFMIWLVANNVGGHEPLIINPVNGWAATLILAVALDLGRQGIMPRRRGE